MFRIGLGYDVHKLIENKDLIIAGVKIPHTMGLLAHSDGDVLVHALMDSILGALALRDIGTHFPDTDLKYKDANSMELLDNVYNKMIDSGYVINNIDCTIIAQKPKMAPHIENMRINIARVLHVDLDRVNIKATTEEGLGFTGKEEGIASQCICLLCKN